MALPFELREEASDEDARKRHVAKLLDEEEFGRSDAGVGKRAPQTQKRNTSSKKAPGLAKGRVNKSQASSRGHGATSRTSTMQNGLKIIVGVDFGTTFSGVSYTTNLESADNTIVTIMKWPGREGEELSKAPSIIAYGSENKSDGDRNGILRENRFGYEVRPRMVSCAWMKLLMAMDAETTEYDDPLLKAAVSSGIARTPENKTPVEVAADFLSLIRHHLMERLVQSFTSEILRTTPIELFVTIPAIWDDNAMTNTKMAIQKAGFLDEPVKSYHLVSEPEAAAVAVLKQFYGQNTTLLKVGMVVVVADLGGGTIDAESMRVESLCPLKLKIIGIGEGGKFGSTTIDRSFMAFMHETFGTAFANIAPHKRGAASKFMNDFEAEKKTFRGRSSEEHRISLPELGDQLNVFREVNASYDMEDKEVVLKLEDMVNLFSGVVSQILGLIERQVQKLWQETKQKPDAIVLVGGLSSSEWILQKVRSFCEEKFGSSVKLLRPDSAWGAISRGAVAYGLDRTTFISRVARRHYFLTAGRAFVEGEDPEDRSAMCPLYGKRVRGELKLLLEKVVWTARLDSPTDERQGSTVSATNPKRIKGYVVLSRLDRCNIRDIYKVFCSTSDEKPRWEDDPGVTCIGELSINLYKIKAKWERKGWNSTNVDASENPIEVGLNIVVRGGYGAGQMSIQAKADGQDVGQLELNFN